MERPGFTNKQEPSLHRVLGKRDLVLLFVVAVANLNLVPPIASSGPTSLWLWVLAFLLFFWPQGVAVTELSQKWPGEGGIYLWSKESFGERHGFLAGWTYWLAQVFYLPTIVLSCVGVGLYVAGAAAYTLVDNPYFTGCVSIFVILLLTALNIRGLSIGKWINNLGGFATVVGSLALCLLAGFTMRHHHSSLHPSQLKISHLDWRILTVFGTICYSLVGLDLASIMGGEIREPRRNLPISIFIGGLLAGLIYIGTTASMLIAMPQKEIGLLAGILQAISVMGNRTGLSVIVRPLALMECLAILGTASAWFAGSARLPFVAGVDRYLPRAMGRVHKRYDTPYVSLIVFAVLSSLLVCMSFLGATVGEAYLTLLDLSVILQLLPTAYLFAALLKHAWSRDGRRQARRWYLMLNGIFGVIATTVGLCLAFIPSHLVSSIWTFEWKLAGGCLLVFGAAYLFYRHGAKLTRDAKFAGEEHSPSQR